MEHLGRAVVPQCGLNSYVQPGIRRQAAKNEKVIKKERIIFLIRLNAHGKTEDYHAEHTERHTYFFCHIAVQTKLLIVD